MDEYIERAREIERRRLEQVAEAGVVRSPKVLRGLRTEVGRRQSERHFLARAGYFKAVADAAGSCVRCGGDDHLTVDHILEVSRGGTHELENLQVLCRDCHDRKHRGQDYRPIGGAEEYVLRLRKKLRLSLTAQDEPYS